MNDGKINEIVAAAVGAKFDEWAALHPSLASVIDRIALTELAVERLRDSQAYRQAMEAYQRDRDEMNLVGRLADLAAPVIHSLLGL